MGFIRELRRLFKLPKTYGGSAFVWPGGMPIFPLTQQQSVTANNATTLPPVYRAINLIGNDVARLDFSVQRKDGTSWRKVDSPVADLIGRTPNRYCGAFPFRRDLMRDLCLWGNAFALISRTNGGEVIELIQVKPETIKLDPREDGTVQYSSSDYGRILSDEILHFRLSGIRPYWGDSPIQLMRRTLELQAQQEIAGYNQWKMPGLGKIAIKTAENLGSEHVEALQDRFESVHGSSSGMMKPIVAQAGADVLQIGTTLTQQDWIAARRFSVTQVSQMFGVPPQFLFNLEAATLDHSQSQVRSYVHSLDAYLALVGDEITQKLLSPGERVAFDTRVLLRGSFMDEGAALRLLIETGVMSRNEARDFIGLERLDGLDEMTMSKNYEESGVEDEEPVAELEPDAIE